MLQELLACPNPDHGTLELRDSGYVCQTCGEHFEIRDGIPVLIGHAHG